MPQARQCGVTEPDKLTLSETTLGAGSLSVTGAFLRLSVTDLPATQNSATTCFCAATRLFVLLYLSKKKKAS